MFSRPRPVGVTPAKPAPVAATATAAASTPKKPAPVSPAKKPAASPEPPVVADLEEDDLGVSSLEEAVGLSTIGDNTADLLKDIEDDVAELEKKPAAAAKAKPKPKPRAKAAAAAANGTASRKRKAPSKEDEEQQPPATPEAEAEAEAEAEKPVKPARKRTKAADGTAKPSATAKKSAAAAKKGKKDEAAAAKAVSDAEEAVAAKPTTVRARAASSAVPPEERTAANRRAIISVQRRAAVADSDIAHLALRRLIIPADETYKGILSGSKVPDEFAAGQAMIEEKEIYPSQGSRIARTLMVAQKKIQTVPVTDRKELTTKRENQAREAALVNSTKSAAFALKMAESVGCEGLYVFSGQKCVRDTDTNDGRPVYYPGTEATLTNGYSETLSNSISLASINAEACKDGADPATISGKDVLRVVFELAGAEIVAEKKQAADERTQSEEDYAAKRAKAAADRKANRKSGGKKAAAAAVAAEGGEEEATAD